MARRMSVGQQVASLDSRIGRFEANVDSRFRTFEAKVDDRFTKVDERFTKVDERFDKVDERFDKVDARFARVDERLIELRRHFDVIAESWDGKFALLYDFFKAYAERTDRRFDELTRLVQSNHAELRATIKLTYASLDRRVTALERRVRPGRRRR